MTNETAAEQCEYCGRAIWVDEDWESYVTSDGELDCSAAPLVTNPAGAQYPPISGSHEAA
jgi:hypothetical protein